MKCSLWNCNYPENYVFKFPKNVANKNVYVNYHLNATTQLWHGEIQFRGPDNIYSPKIRFKYNVAGVVDSISWERCNYALILRPIAMGNSVEYRVYTYRVIPESITAYRHGIYEAQLELDVLAFEQVAISHTTIISERYDTTKSNNSIYRSVNYSFCRDEMETQYAAPNVEFQGVDDASLLPSSVLDTDASNGFYLLTVAQSGYHN